MPFMFFRIGQFFYFIVVINEIAPLYKYTCMNGANVFRNVSEIIENSILIPTQTSV